MAPSKGWGHYRDAEESSTATRSGCIQSSRSYSYPNASAPTVGGGGTRRLDKYGGVVKVEEGEPAGCSEKDAVARRGYHTGRYPDTAPRLPTPVGAELTGFGIEGGTRANDMPIDVRGDRHPTPVAVGADNNGDMQVDVSGEGVHRRPTPFGAELKALGIEGGTRPLPVEVEEGAPADVASRRGYRSSPRPALADSAHTGSGKAAAFCLPVAPVGRGGGGGRGDKEPYIYDRTARPPDLVLAPAPTDPQTSEKIYTDKETNIKMGDTHMTNLNEPFVSLPACQALDRKSFHPGDKLDGRKVMIPTQALLVNMCIPAEYRGQGYKIFSKNAEPELIHCMQKINNDYRTEVLGMNDYNAESCYNVTDTPSELPEFLGDCFACSDKGGSLVSKKGHWQNHYILKMNYYLKTCSAMDGKPVCDTQEKNSFDPRYNELMGKQGVGKHFCTRILVKYDESESDNTGFFCAQCGSCENIKRSGETQVFVYLCGSTISLQKDLKTLHVEMLSEAACVKAGVKSNDFYSTFCGMILEPKQLLAHYNIKRDCTIRMNPRLRGGSSGYRNWDDIMRGLDRYHMMSLTTDLVLPQHLTVQGPVMSKFSILYVPVDVKFLGDELQFRSRSLLVYLCRKHYSGLCFGGRFTSEQILFDDDDNVRISAAQREFTKELAFCDYKTLYGILNKAFRDEDDSYPLLAYHLLTFLNTPPPEINPQSESMIAFMTNHLSLMSHTQRISISGIMVMLVGRLSEDDLSLFGEYIGKQTWVNNAGKVTAFDTTLKFFHWYDHNGNMRVPYVDTGVSLLQFSNNFFKHSPYLTPEQRDAAFTLFTMHNNFMAQLMYDALFTFKAAKEEKGLCVASADYFVDQVIGMLGRNTIGCKKVTIDE